MTEECWRGLVSRPAGWLVSTVQLSGAPDSYIYNCIAEIYYNYFNIAKARREKRSRGEREGGKWSEEEREEARERRGSERTHTGEHKRERVRGGCLGAEGR